MEKQVKIYHPDIKDSEILVPESNWLVNKKPKGWKLAKTKSTKSKSAAKSQSTDE